MNCQILFQVLFRPGYADELDQPVAGVIGEPVGLHHRDDAVIVSWEGLVLAGIKALVAAMRIDQPWLVETVAAHHAADGVGEEAFDVFFTVRAVERDLVVRNFGREFVLQAVGVYEEAVVLFFQLLHALETGKCFRVSGGLRLGQRGGSLLEHGQRLEVP